MTAKYTLLLQPDPPERPTLENLITDSDAIASGLALYRADAGRHDDTMPRWTWRSGLFVLLDGDAKDDDGKSLTVERIAQDFLHAGLSNIADTATRYVGSFAMTVYHSRTRRGIVLRDRYGLLPVFYGFVRSAQTGGWCVGNSPLALARALGATDVNEQYLARYLVLRYDEVFGHAATFFRHVHNLPAASHVELRPDSAPVRYWHDFDRTSHTAAASKPEAVLERLRGLLKDSVATAVVPIPHGDGILGMSGGMDSTSVAAICHTLGRPLHSFTASYASAAAVDEVLPAQAAAAELCRSWTPVALTPGDFIGAWSKAYEIHEQPMATSSCLGYDLLCAKIRALGYRWFVTGGSSDDLFAGNYPAYLYNLCDLVETDAAAFASELSDWIRNHSTQEFPKDLAVFLAFYGANIVGGDERLIRPKARTVQTSYVRPEALPAALASVPGVTVSGATYLDAYQKYGIWYSAKPPGQMPFIEGARFYGVDVVDPFLSEPLIRFAFSLPSRFKIRGGRNKVILREAMRAMLPPHITGKVAKTGFDVPFGEWLRQDVVREFVADVLGMANVGAVADFIDLPALRAGLLSGGVERATPMFVWQTVNAIMWLDAQRAAHARAA